MHIDASKSDPSIKRAYSRLLKGAGKGSAPRNIFSQDFRDNYDAIFRKARNAKGGTDRGKEV